MLTVPDQWQPGYYLKYNFTGTADNAPPNTSSTYLDDYPNPEYNTYYEGPYGSSSTATGAIGSSSSSDSDYNSRKLQRCPTYDYQEYDWGYCCNGTCQTYGTGPGVPQAGVPNAGTPGSPLDCPNGYYYNTTTQQCEPPSGNEGGSTGGQTLGQGTGGTGGTGGQSVPPPGEQGGTPPVDYQPSSPPNRNCPSGYHYDDVHGGCVRNEPPPVCSPGYHVNPATNKCVQDQPPCKPGQGRTPDGYCYEKECMPGERLGIDCSVCHVGQVRQPDGTCGQPPPPPSGDCPVGQHFDSGQKKCIPDNEGPNGKCPVGTTYAPAPNTISGYSCWSNGWQVCPNGGQRFTANPDGSTTDNCPDGPGTGSGGQCCPPQTITVQSDCPPKFNSDAGEITGKPPYSNDCRQFMQIMPWALEQGEDVYAFSDAGMSQMATTHSEELSVSAVKEQRDKFDDDIEKEIAWNYQIDDSKDSIASIASYHLANS